MKPERINQLIAECRGWRDIHLTSELNPEANRSTYWAGNHKEYGLELEIPNYYRDLNAIMEAVKEVILGYMDLEQAFMDSLNAILDARADDESGPVICLMEMAMITADPGEFCEAFLRAVKKWEEEL